MKHRSTSRAVLLSTAFAGLSGPGSAALAALILLAGTGSAWGQDALPNGGVFVQGQGQIGQPSPSEMQITQTSQRGVIDWRSFSVADQHRVLIDNGTGATLNRVQGGQISRIDGQFSATGTVYLMNPHGVIVGPGGKVLTGGSFVASTRAIDPDAFMQGGVLAASGSSGGGITNQGTILSERGSVVLIGRDVSNGGTIQAGKGRVTLAAADVLMATTDGSAERIYVSYAAGGGDVTQTGRIQAAAAELHAAGGNVFALAGNRDGLVQATGSAEIAGELWLVAPQGKVEVAGTLKASNADGSGGRVTVNGREVALAATADIAAVGTRGGEVLIGTSAYGSGSNLAQTTVIADGARISAGGPGGGGRIETSGKHFDLGTAHIRAGQGGTWLIDPNDLLIDAAAATTIVSALDAGGGTVRVETTAGGTGGVGDITVAAPIQWTDPTGNLALDAYRNIAVNAEISGPGNVDLVAGGDLAINALVSGRVMFANVVGTVTINAGGQFRGTDNVGVQAANFVNLAGASALNSTGGNWFVATNDAAGSNDGGLTPDYYLYDYLNVPVVPQAGNGRFYLQAPSVSFTLGAVTKAYDGTTDALLDASNVTVTGLVNGDVFTLDGSYATKDAGTGINVTATNFEASRGGIPVFNYNVTTPSVTAAVGTINPMVLVASIIGTPTKTYNASTSVSLTAANFQLVGVVAGETITVSAASAAAYDSANAGSRTVDATLTSTNFTAGSGTLLTNYVLPTSASGAGLINPASILISGVAANDKVYDGTTAALLDTGSAAIFGVVGSDDVQLDSSGAGGVFATKNVGNAIAVTGTGFALSGTAAGNYVVSQPTGLAANITRASLVVTGVTANDKVYDGTRFAAVNTAGLNVTGLISGDDVTPVSAGGQIAFAQKDVADNILVTISGVALSGGDAGNYNLSFASNLTADITPRPLTLTGAGTPTKVYDGNTNAFVDSSQVALGNMVSGETITITQASGLTYASKNVGTWDIDIALSPSDYQAGTGTLLSNYILPSVGTIQGDITPAPLTITIIGNPTKTYDGNASASLGPSNFEVDGFVTGESATVTQTSGTYSSANAGVWTVSADLDAGDFDPATGTMMSNYYIPSPVTGAGTIVRRNLGPGVVTVDITGNPTKTYDGNTIATLTSSDYTLGGFIAGEGATITETVGTYAAPDAGQQAVVVQLDPSDYDPFPGTNLSNYTLPSEATGIGTILKAPLGALIIGNPTRVYNGQTRIALSAGNFSFTGLVSGESITANAVIANYDSDNAGSRTITVGFPSQASFTAGANTKLSNYLLPTNATGPGTITPAPLNILNVTALDKVYDQTTVATLAGAASLFGVITGDDVVLSAAGSNGTFATPNVGSGIAVTVAGFSISGADSANYQLFQPTGLTASITPRGLTIANLTANDKNYDGTTAATLGGSATLVGVLSGDTVLLNGTGSTASFLQSNVGNNLRVNIGGFTLLGAQAGNYTLAQPSGLTASILPLALTGAILGNPTKTYDGSASVSLTAANYSLSGFIAGEGGTITQSSGAAYDSANAGARTVTATLVVSDFVANSGTLLSNYVLPTAISGPGTINQALLTAAIIGNPTKVYDATAAATLTSANYQLSGFIGSDGATVTQTSGLYDSKNVGGRTVTATLGTGDFTGTGSTVLGNYILPASASGAGTITQAQVQVIQVIANDKVYDGTTAATLDSSSAALSGVFGGDTVNLVSAGATGVFATKNVGTNIAVTASGYTIAGGDSANYTLLQPTGLVADITQATIQLASVTRVYDATTAAPTVNSAYALSGVFGSDQVFVDASGISGNYDNKNVGTGKGITLAGVALGGTDAPNYLISATTTNAPIGIITPATLTVTGVGAQDKIYDQSAVATLLNGSAALAGVLGSDNVVLDTSGSSGTFVNGSGNPDANAGLNKRVATAGYVVTGTDATNYVVTQPDYVTASILPRPITLTSVVKTYDGATTLPADAAAYGFTGILSGDSVTANASAATGSYADRNVAGSITGGVVTGGINVDVSGLLLAGPQGNNYSVADVVAAPIGVIDPRALTAAIIGTPTKTYDATNTATLVAGNYQITGFVSGEGATVTQTAGTYSSINAGSRTVTATLAGGDFAADGGTSLSNYTLPTSASGAGLINQAVLTISGVLANDKVYDGTTAATLNSTGAVLNGVVPGEPLTITLNSSGATGVFAQAAVGTGIAVTAGGYAVNGDVNNNYILTQPTGLTANITQALLQLVQVTRVYNGLLTLPSASAAYTLSGVVSGDDVFLDTGGISGAYATKDVASGINVDIAGIALGGASAGNYSIAASLTAAPIGVITPATLSASVINNPTRVYDGTNAATLAASNYQLTGFVAGEGATVTETAGTYDSANAGPRIVTVVLGGGDFSANSGTLLSNYTLPTGATGAGTIDRATLTAGIIGTPTKTYDGNSIATLVSGNYQLTGFVAGEGATVTQTMGSYAAADAGPRIVTATLAAGDFTANSGTLLANYVLPTSAAGAGLINRATLTAAIIGNPTKTYDGNDLATLASGNYQLTGFVSGEGATVTQTAGTYDSANAGSRVVTALLAAGDFTANSGTSLANYTLPLSASGAGTIGQKALTALVIGDPTRAYNGTTAATLASSNYLLTGFVGSEGATVTQTVGSYASANAGARLVTALLSGGDFTADAGTSLANYALPASATGMGTITRLALGATIIGNPTKVYDGNTAALLASGNYALTGFIAGEGAAVTETVGSYDDKNAGARIVTATLDAGDFTATGSTLLDNYVLPLSASGAGTIGQRTVSAVITGLPTKVYDATIVATLASSNYALSGFVAGEGATITRTTGSYGSPNAGIRQVTTTLGSGDFVANGGTSLSNYVLPTGATGAGIIDRATLTAAIIGNPSKTYDATTTATLTSANYQLSGFVAGQSATVTETAGLYDSANAGARTVTAALGSADFVAGSGTLLTNYVLPASATGAGTITAAQLTAVIIGNPTKTYDATTAATLAAGNYQLSGFIGSDGATVSQSVGSYDNANAGGRTVTANLGASDFTGTGTTLLSNYLLPTSASGAGTISQAALTALIIGNPSKTYDGTTAATLASANYTLVGFVTGEGATVTQTVGAYGAADAGLRSVTALLGTGDFTANSGTQLSNYVLPGSATGTGTIGQATLVATIIGNPSKTYDGSATATLASTNYALTGFIAGESATVTQTAGLYGSPNAGLRTVTAVLGSGDFTPGAGTSLGNYVLPTAASGLGTIAQALLTAAIIGNPSKTYDGNTVATLTSGNYALTGFVAGEGATVSQSAGVYDSANAGSRTVSATLGSADFVADAGTLLANYVLPTAASGAGTIGQAALVASIIGNPTKTYDATTGATLVSGNYTLTGFIGSDGATVTQTVGSYGAPDAGIRTVSAMLGSGDFTADAGTSLGNYLLPTTATGLGTIDPKVITLVVLSFPDRVYDGTNFAILDSTRFQLFGFLGSDGVAIESSVTGTYSSANVGLHSIAISPSDTHFLPLPGTNLGNYVLRSGANGVGRITPAPLTATLVDVFKTYDGTTAASLSPGNFVLTGFVAGEGGSITQTAGSYASPDAGLRAVSAALGTGDYLANAGTLLSNYLLPTSATGIGRIDQAQLSAAIIGNPTRTYDGTVAAALNAGNYQLTGFISGEGATVTQALGTYDSPNAGPRSVSASLTATDFAANAGTQLGNYILPVSASGAGTIAQAALTASIVGDPSRAYDGTTIAALTSANYALAGFVAGEGATVTQAIGAYDDPNAGARTVSASLAAGDFVATGGTLLSNYILPSDASGAGTIGQAMLTASIIGNPSRIYDGTDLAVLGAVNYQLTGFIGTESATITQTAGRYDSANAGARTVIALLGTSDFAAGSGTNLGNYILPTSASGAGTIGQAVLTASIIGNPTRVYDGTDIAVLGSANYQLTGFIGTESATVTQTAGRYDSANAGARTITALLAAGDFAAGSGTSLANYVLPISASGAGTIDRAVLTATITGDPTKPYDGNTDAVLDPGDYTLAGFVTGEGASVTETHGSYDAANVGTHVVSAALDPADFAANSGTDLANYILPSSASGPGEITGGNCAGGGCLPDVPDFHRWARAMGNPRFYIPYPALDPIYQGSTNGFAGLPSIILPLRLVPGPRELLIANGARTVNSTEQILLGGRRGTQWTIRTTLPDSVGFEARP